MRRLMRRMCGDYASAKTPASFPKARALAINQFFEAQKVSSATARYPDFLKLLIGAHEGRDVTIKSQSTMNSRRSLFVIFCNVSRRMLISANMVGIPFREKNVKCEAQTTRFTWKGSLVPDASLTSLGEHEGKEEGKVRLGGRS